MGSVRDENFLTSSITTFARRSLLHAISFLIRPMHATFPAYVLPLHWPHVRSRKKRATRHAFSPSPCYVLSFRPKYTVHTPLSAHSHTARSSTWTRDQISPPPPQEKTHTPHNINTFTQVTETCAIKNTELPLFLLIMPRRRMGKGRYSCKHS
jgi:hypothetical protein